MPYTASEEPNTLPLAFTADTFTAPTVKEEEILTVIEVVPAPETIVIPDGTVQL